MRPGANHRYGWGSEGLRSVRFRVIRLVLATAAACLAVALGNRGTPVAAQDDRLSTLDDRIIRICADLDLGGAITVLGPSGSDVNLVNSADWGRQIQMSHYSGPVPFLPPNGKHPTPTWAGLGWNPIQSGDCFGHRSRVVEHTNDGATLYVKCIPMQWPLENEPGECTYESWITLEGNTAHVRGRMVNQRTDHTQYTGRDQELPAVYTNGPWWRLMTYTGDAPYTGGELTQIPASMPWTAWLATEHWAALVDDAGWGLGIWEPTATRFLGGFAGEPGKGGPKDGPTGYIAPLQVEILDWNVVYEYEYTLIVGSLEEIRKHVTDHAGPSTPPSWRFEHDRQHWSYVNAVDAGWPIEGELNVLVEGDDPQLTGPTGFWRAEEAPRLVIEGAWQTTGALAQVFWSRHDREGLRDDQSGRFPVTADGQMRTYAVDLGASPEYRGAITGLRIDPVDAGGPGESVRIRSIGFEGPAGP